MNSIESDHCVTGAGKKDDTKEALMGLLQLAAEVFNTGQALVAALPPLPLLPHPLPLEIVVAQNNFFKKKNRLRFLFVGQFNRARDLDDDASQDFIPRRRRSDQLQLLGRTRTCLV